MRKKAKRNKKFSRETGLTEVECRPGEGTSQTGPNNGIHNRVSPLPYASKSADTSSESGDICNGNNSEGSNTRGYACTSCIEKVDFSESLTHSVLSSFSSEHHVSDFEDGFQTKYPGYASLNGEVQDTKCELSNYSDVYSETNDCPVLDSLSLGPNGGKCLDSDNEITLSNEENAGNNIPKSPDCAAGEGCYSPSNRLKGIAAIDSHGEKTNCSTQGCYPSVSYLEVLVKTTTKSKRVPKNSSRCSVSNVGNLNGLFGRENISAWQKVQTNDAQDCIHASENMNPVCSQFGVELKEAPLLKNHSSVVRSILDSDAEVKKQTIKKVYGKVERESNQGSKQECNNYYKKSPRAVRASSNMCARVDVQQNELCAFPVQVNGENGLDTMSRSHYSKTSSGESMLHTTRVESITLKSLQSSQACLKEVEPLAASSLNDQNLNQTSLSSISYTCLDTSELPEKLSAVHLHKPIDYEGASSEDLKQDASSGSIEVKGSGSFDSSLRSGLSIVKLDEPAGQNRSPKNSKVEESASESQCVVRAPKSSLMCMGLSLNDVSGSPPKNVVQLKNLRNQMTSSVKELDSVIDSTKILSRVSDAHRAQVTSEAIQLATGCPIGEFEKLLHSASPVICSSHSIGNCQTCSCGSVVNESLCRRQMPDISLGGLWQWYEKHGSYGLEVMAEDYENSTRMGIDGVVFRAYFVPYLSAIQLFRNRKDCQTNDDNVLPASPVVKASEMFKASESSNNTNFSILIPHPRAENSGLLAPGISDKSAVSFSEKVPTSAVQCGWSEDKDLLFEYFESEQPQRRRPLFEKIKELVQGDVSSQCRAYGDATILNSVGLHDLHPTSWYSVAWYPIYRIPEGNFRAAFLTYHSLGHLVRRRPAFDSTCMDASIVSPVVGLQSYNAQDECWFLPRHSADILNSNPAGILKERLRTLEQVASVMARAVIIKGNGNETSVNRQPDYEFFLSRRRY